MRNRARKSIGRLFVGIALVASSLTATWATAATPITTLKPGVLQVCLYAGFAPFTYKANGVWKGWDLDYLTAFASANGRAIEVVEEPHFEGIWLKPGEGKCDIAGSGISDTAERRAAVNARGCWSRTYYHVLRSFLVRSQERTLLTKIEDLRGKRAIVTIGSTAHLDLCTRMQLAEMRACTRPDGSDPCANLDEVSRTTDPSCVIIENPRNTTKPMAQPMSQTLPAPTDHSPTVGVMEASRLW